MFQDYLLYATDAQVRYAFRLLHLSHLVNDAKNMHLLNIPRSILLGDALLGGVLLASILEEEERINLRIQCASDFTIGTETTRHAETRGYISCSEQSSLVSSLDSGKAILPTLHVRTLRSGSNAQALYQGISQSEQSTLEKALNEHLHTSFQTKTQIKLQTWFDDETQRLNSLGVIFLELPNLDQDTSKRLWGHVDKLPPFKELAVHLADPDKLVGHLIPDPARPVNSVNPKWSCTCSQKSVDKIISSLPSAEIESMILGNEPIHVRCHYCNKNIEISQMRLIEILNSILPSPPQTERH